MPRLKTNLRTRLEQPEVSDALKLRWMQELVSAVAWEKLGLAHGDIRISNALVDRDDHLKLSDFDATVDIGEDIRSFTVPYWDGYHDVAGPLTEQFAIGSCLYHIFVGKEADIVATGYPRTSKDLPKAEDIPFRLIILKCWTGKYSSIAELDAEVANLSVDSGKNATTESTATITTAAATPATSSGIFQPMGVAAVSF